MPYRAWLLVAFGVLFGISAVDPWHPQDFILEHVLTFIALGALIRVDRRRPISNLSATLVFAFLCLHLLGAHYTYSEVPYDAWTTAIFGSPASDWFGWTRNNYDRLVHLCFGLLLVYPMRELLSRFFPEIRLHGMVNAACWRAT